MIAKEIYSIGYKLSKKQSWRDGKNPYITHTDGEYRVESLDKKELLAVLNFKNQKLNGKAVFYDGTREERFVYKDDMMHGWGVVLENSIEELKLYYENGVLKRKLLREESRDGYWMEVDVFSNVLLGYFILDEDNKRVGIGYSCFKGVIEGVYEFIGDEKRFCFKSMKDGVMKEYSKEKELIYEGFFKNCFEEDFPRSEEQDPSAIVPVSSYPQPTQHMWKEFFPAGCHVDTPKVNNMMEGTGKVFSEFGVPLAELSFVHNELDGVCVFMNKFGEREKEICFEKGTRQGWFCYYDQSGITKMGLHENDIEVSLLRLHSQDPSFLEELVDGKVVRVCKYNENHKRDGLCGVYKDDHLQSVIRYENGVEKGLVYEFDGEILLEYENEQIVYRGEFSGDLSKGFERKGIGSCYQYSKDEIRVDRVMDGVKQGYQIIADNMKEYSQLGQLRFEGGYNGSVREGFSRNEEKWGRRIEEDRMIEIEEGLIVYVGEYSKEDYGRCGKGRTIQYEDGNVKEVIEWDGDYRLKRMTFDKNNMTEYGKDGSMEYKGEYKGNAELEFVRYGTGYEYDKNEYLIYMGGWVDGKREGEGRYYTKAVLKYSGNWKKGKPDGPGCWWDGHDRKYDGEWKEGRFEIEDQVWFDFEKEEIVKIHVESIESIKDTIEVQIHDESSDDDGVQSFKQWMKTQAGKRVLLALIVLAIIIALIGIPCGWYYMIGCRFRIKDGVLTISEGGYLYGSISISNYKDVTSIVVTDEALMNASKFTIKSLIDVN